MPLYTRAYQYISAIFFCISQPNCPSQATLAHRHRPIRPSHARTQLDHASDSRERGLERYTRRTLGDAATGAGDWGGGGGGDRLTGERCRRGARPQGQPAHRTPAARRTSPNRRSVDDSDSKRPEEDQHKPTPNPGPSPPQYIEGDQHAPQQTPTPKPGPSTGQFLDVLLDKAFVDYKLQVAQRRKRLLDATTVVESPEDREPSVLLENEFRDTKTLEEASITNSSSVPQSPSRENRETNVLKEWIDTKTLDKSCISSFSPSLMQALLCEVPDPLALKLGSALMSSSYVSSFTPTGLFIEYFVRFDKQGNFHTYPDRGGPFQTLQAAQEAIDSHHAEQREMMRMDGLSDEERAVRNTLYWYHDGTRKHSVEAFASCTTHCPTEELLKALLDRHNEDNDLLGDRAYELEDIVRHNSCFDGEDCIYSSYSHFNLTMKTKRADANKNLYFAEVTCMSGDYEAYVLTCFCEVKPDHNGQCSVCEVEMEDMKHPIDDVYNRGRSPKFFVRSRRSDTYGVDLFEQLFAVHDEAWLIAEEARVRRMIKEGKEARRSKLEVDRGDVMIKKEKEASHKFEVDVARRKLEVDEASGKLEVDYIPKEAMHNKLEVDCIPKEVRRSKLDSELEVPKEARPSELEVDNRGDGMIKDVKDARRSKLDVDHIGDAMIKDVKEARRGKLEANNRRDDHGKRDKYVIPVKRK